MEYTRIPILIAVVLFVVAGSVLNLSYLKAGALFLMATFIYLTSIVIFIMLRCYHHLDKTAQRGLLIVIAALPLYTVRVIYLLLVEFGDIKFDPLVGDWRFVAGMGLTMEAGIVVLLIIIGVVIEPLVAVSKIARVLPTAKMDNTAEVGLDVSSSAC